ncbi:MAG: LysR family transcriptional regulator, partial [Nisaea sp.]
MARFAPPLNWFRVFQSAARHLSFTAAARELGLTQSAVSQQVRALEGRLGVALFHRQARGIALTDNGRRLLPEITSGLSMLDNAVSQFDFGPREELVTVATSISFAHWRLAPVLSRFLSVHPTIKVRLLSTVWSDEFNSTFGDIEIRFGSAELVGKDSERLQHDSLIAVAAPSLLSSGRAFEEHPLIEAVGTSGGWAEWCAQSGYAPAPQPSLFVDHHGIAVQMATNGVGIALTSSLLARPSLEKG